MTQSDAPQMAQAVDYKVVPPPVSDLGGSGLEPTTPFRMRETLSVCVSYSSYTAIHLTARTRILRSSYLFWRLAARGFLSAL